MYAFLGEHPRPLEFDLNVDIHQVFLVERITLLRLCYRSIAYVNEIFSITEDRLYGFLAAIAPYS